MMKAPFLAALLCGCARAVELQSGYILQDDVAPELSAPVVVTSTVWYRGTDAAVGGGDNIVGTTAAITAFAAKEKAKKYGSGGSFLRDAGPDGDVPLKSFFSELLHDTLTTASTEGLAWASNPAHGYKFMQIEGYCSTKEDPSGGAEQLVQYWSAGRNDSYIVAKGSGDERSATSAKYELKWTECYVKKPPPPSCRSGTDCGGTGQWTRWEDKPPTPSYSNPGTIPFPKSKDLLGWEYKSGANPGYGGGDHVARSADTWYPSWGADGNLYSPWTDGHVVDDETHKSTGSGSGRRREQEQEQQEEEEELVSSFSGLLPLDGVNDDAGPRMTTTGQAIIVGDDPFSLNITKVKTFPSSPFPYQGRYPCGSLMYKGTWWYGTYMLDNPNATVGNNSVGPNPGPNCGNWCIQGPVTDFRHSTDKGVTWHEERVVAKDSRDNLFGETAQNNSRVKFGAPHWVDFGQELEHSPDGKAYLVGHGATSPESIQAWMLGDQVYMARVTPTVQDIADKKKWEFYAGGHGASAKWVTGDVSQAKPLVSWTNHTGVVTMTYFAPIKKYVLSISTASIYPFMTHQFDTYFLESDAITGPWSYVTYMSMFGPEAYFVNHPSKFSAKQANTSAKTYDAFLMYSANFAFHDKNISPPNSAYHMNLQQARFPLSDAFAAKLEQRYAAEAAAAKEEAATAR